MPGSLGHTPSKARRFTAPEARLRFFDVLVSEANEVCGNL